MNKKLTLSVENKIFIFFSASVFLFFLICTGLLIKTDDGHFSGIAANEGFALAEWLRHRYETISGRTSGEFLVMIFLKIPILFWKLLASGCCIFIVWFTSKISDSFGTKQNKINRLCVCCCMIFLVGIGSLNAGAFWYSGSFTYLIPCTAMLLTLAPAVFTILEIKASRKLCFSAIFAAIIAVSQEQSAVCTCSFFVILFVISLVNKKIKPFVFIPFIPSLIGTFYLLSSPGAQNRNLSQSSEGFSAYADFGVANKLLCGFTNYLGYSFYTSIFVTLLFAALVCILFYQTSVNKKTAKGLSAAVFSFFVFVCGVINILCFAVKKTSFDKFFQKCFQNGEYDAWFYIGALPCFFAIILLFAMIVNIMRKDSKTGISAGLLASAAICCGIMPGFSSSVYLSGQRLFFFTDILMLISCVILYSKINSQKAEKIIMYLCSSVSLSFFIFDIFTFTLMEIPIMG